MTLTSRLVLSTSVFASFLGVVCSLVQAGEEKKTDNGASIKAVIVCDVNNPTLDFARDELSRFLAGAGAEIVQARESSAPDGTWRFVLRVESGMVPGSFRMEGKKDEKGAVVELAGADATCVLHAVYTALERIGYRFEISGPTTPLPLDINRLLGDPIVIRPAVRLRGPRLYLNFPMDLSSYPLDQAKEYVRNIARMRFNLFSVHSYVGVFIQVLGSNGKDQLAGNLFYGDRHDIPDFDWLKGKIHNKEVYCLPEIEPVIDDPRARSERAVGWLRAVLEEAKRVGLTIQFSFEPTRADTELTETLRTAEAIVQSYPKVDILELVTTEGGSTGKYLTADEMVKLYGNQEILKFADSTTRPEGSRYHPLLGEIGHNVLAIRELQKQWQGQNKPKLKCGLYNNTPDHFANYLEVMDRYTPAEIDIGTLPGYASQYTAEYVRQTKLPPSLLRRFSVYSWLELDGIMYLHQNSLEGIYQLVKDLAGRCGAEPIPYISFIHWRETENRLPARYAALACLFGPIPLDSFYRDYGADLGFGSYRWVFAEAMSEWNRTDDWTHRHMSSIGFCCRGCWSAKGGLGSFATDGWNDMTISKAVLDYEHIHEMFKLCAKHTSNKAGQEYLAFLDHRVRCNIIYLKAISKGTELHDLCGNRKPEDLTADEKQQVVRICDDALMQMDQWMEFYAELMPDRGAEGMLISFYHTPPAELKRIRYEFGGVGKDEVPKSTASVPLPPEPLIFNAP